VFVLSIVEQRGGHKGARPSLLIGLVTCGLVIALGYLVHDAGWGWHRKAIVVLLVLALMVILEFGYTPFKRHFGSHKEHLGR
jgi:peptidoglycan/LPS O-acetylase OafA/YrhL